MNDPFQTLFNELSDSYAERFADDETELAPDDYLHWFGDQLSADDRQFIIQHILDWDALVLRHTEFFTCAVCERYSPPLYCSESEGKRYCKKCRRAPASGTPAAAELQPTLF